MLISHAKFETVFRKIKQIEEYRNAYCLAPDRAKMSVEDLQWCIENMYDLKIEKKEVAFEGVFLSGMVERYERRARILLRKDQPEDALRFVTTKELCQLAIDEPEDWSPRGTETIDAYMNELRLDLGGGPERDLAPDLAQSERLAFLAAIELMYPFRYRTADALQVKDGKMTLRAIAVHFHVPEFVVGQALHVRHLELAARGWEMVADRPLVG
jgi:hypothetical protein